MIGSIRQRGKGSWELSIDIGRDAQGKRRRKFVNVKGTKSAAQRRLRELLSQLDKGASLDASKVTVNEYLDRWMKDYVAPQTRSRTAETYEGIIRLHLKPALGHLLLGKLQPLDIEEKESDLTKAGKSPRTVLHVH